MKYEKTIVIASNNKNKVEEFKRLLSNYRIIALKDIGYTEEIEETGNTFEENAIIKAKTIYEYLKNKNLDYIVLADDSGLCVDSLNGDPGVYSARYAGEHGNNQANRDKLQRELEGKDRKAHFTCAIVIIYPDGEIKTVEGKTFGEISKEELGDNGFGYDCIFISDDLKKTFGEATEEEKNMVSHRGRAIKELLKVLNEGY